LNIFPDNSISPVFSISYRRVFLYKPGQENRPKLLDTPANPSRQTKSAIAKIYGSSDAPESLDSRDGWALAMALGLTQEV